MEIARTSLWGFYCRKGASWTQITTDWEHLCGLKIIKSWRFHFSKQKRRTIGQAIWTLFSCHLFQITFISTQLSTIEWRVVSNHLSKVTHMIPSLPKLTWTLSVLSYSLKDYSSHLHIQNKASPRTTFGTFFFHLISFNAPQNLKTAEGNEVEFDHHQRKQMKRKTKPPS